MSATVASENRIDRGETASRIVWKLAGPAVALNSLQVVNNLLDRGFIGRLSASSVTGHSASMNIIFMMFSLAVALSAGGTALVSRAFGANELAEVKVASQQSLNLAVIIGLLIGALSALVAWPAARSVLPSSDHDSIRQMATFVAYYSIGLPAIFVIQCLAGNLRGIGDTVSPMVISGFQILVHIALNFLLIFPTRQVCGITMPGANLGLKGTAIALSTSATISALIYVAYVGRTPLGALWRIRFPEHDWARRILKIAVPAGTMSTLRVLSLTAFTIVLSLVPNGSSAIGAMGIGFAIESIMFMPAFGLGAAAGALVGQSLGMKDPERASRLAWVAAHYAGGLTLVMAGPIAYFAPNIAAALLDDKVAIIHHAALLLRNLCATEVLFAYATVLFYAMQGAGDTIRPLWISMFSLWGLRVPLAFLFALPVGYAVMPWFSMPVGLGLGAAGAWNAMSLTQGLQGVLGILAFRKGAWKTVKV